MNNLRRCSCGATLRIPSELHGKPVRCPRCKASVLPTETAVDHAMSASGAASGPSLATQSKASDRGVFAARESESGQTCPICLSAIELAQLVHRCPDCDIIHHEECWLEIGGCGTFGCKQAPAIDKSEQTVQAPLSAWGDTKVCPVCGETIKSIALRCRYCGMEFNTVDPLSATDLKKQFTGRRESNQLRTIVIMNFVASLTGCLAPFSLLFGLAYILPRRQQLAKAGPLVPVLGWISIVLSALYCLLMLVFYAVSQ